MLISGGVAGLIGLPALFGDAHSYGTTFQAGLGFTGIAVALLGRNNPVGIAFGALLFAFLIEQSNLLEINAGISATSSRSPRACIVLAVVIAYEVVRRYRRRPSSGRWPSSSPPATRKRRPGMTIANDALTPELTAPPRGRSPRGSRSWPGCWSPSRWSPFARVITGANELDSSGTLRAAIIATFPIAAGRPGRPVVRARRRGQHRPRGHDDPRHLGRGVLRLLLRPLGRASSARCCSARSAALLHALATVTFGVDHIVSGVAINIIGLGVAAVPGRGLFLRPARAAARRSRHRLDAPGRFTVPGVSDGPRRARGQALVRGLRPRLRGRRADHATLVADHPGRCVLVVATCLLLWRTAFGLRLRSCGENPSAAETLGVNVYRYKYHRGAGLRRARRPRRRLPRAGRLQRLVPERQTGGRGYIGLAAMIFGNWRPGGMLLGVAPVRLHRRPAAAGRRRAVHALLLLVAIVLLAYGVLLLRRGSRRAGHRHRGSASASLFRLWFLITDEVPRDFTRMTPYVATLLVLAFASQRLRMPAADGQVYRKGSARLTWSTSRPRTVDWAGLAEAAVEAMRRAYAPYSHFPVGAAGAGRRRPRRGRLQRRERGVRRRAVRRVRPGLARCTPPAAAGSPTSSASNGDGEVIMPCGRCRQLLFENGGPRPAAADRLAACGR